MNSRIYFLFWVGVMFIYIFSPPFRGLPLGPDKFLIPFVWAYVFKYRKDFSQFMAVKYVRIFALLLILLSTFLLVRFVAWPANFKPLYHCLQTLLFYIPMTFVWVNEVNRRFKGNYFVNDLLIAAVGIIQVFIITILVFKPSLNLFLQNHVLRNAESGASMVNKLQQDRGYGLGSRFGGCFPTAIGLTFSHILERASVNNFFVKFILLIPFFVLAIIYNARLGVAPILGMACVYFYLARKSMGRILLGVAGIGGSIFILYLGSVLDISFFGLSLRDKFEWLITAFGEFSASSAWDTTYYERLLYGWRWPGGLSNFIGTGEMLFRSGFLIAADMGYANYLYYGGLIYLLLGFFAFSWLFLYPLFKFKSTSIKIVYLVYFSVFLLVNFKGSALIWPDYIRLTLLLCFTSYFRNLRLLGPNRPVAL